MPRLERRPPALETAAVGVGTAVVLLAAMLLTAPPWTLRMDNTGLFLGLTVEAMRAWTRGMVPHWTDGVWGGFPLIGDSTTGALYPPNLAIFWAAGEPPVRAFDIALALHLALLAAGAHRLLGLLGASRAARLVGALLTLLCPFPHWAGVTFFPVTGAYGWWPWSFVAAEELARSTTPRFGRALVLGWIAIAAQVLVGVPEQMVYCVTVLSAWLLTRRAGLGIGERCLRLALLGAGAAALAAPQLVPTAIYLQTTNRTATPAFAGLVAIYLTRPAQLVVAGIGQLNGIPSFYGIATLVLAAIAVARRAPRAGFLAATAGVAFLVSLGAQAPFHGWLQTIPPFGFFRSPIKFQAITELALVWCAALGIDAIWTARRQAARLAAATVVMLAVVEHVAYAAQEIAWLRHQRLVERDDVAVLRTLAESRVLHRRDGVDPPPLVLDTWGQDTARGEQDLLTFARNLSAVEGVSSLVGGSVALLSRRHLDLLQLRPFGPDALDLLGVRYVLVRRPDCERIRTTVPWPIAEETATTCVLENPTRPPRFAFVGAARAVGDEDAMVRLVQQEPAGPVPVLAAATALPPAADRSGDTVTVRRWAPDTADLAVDATHDGLLLVRQSWVPGWSATVDGAPASVLPAAGVFFVVPVPAGAHQVHLRYRTPGLALGTAIAAAWSCGAAAWWLRRRMASARPASRPG